MYFIYDLLIVKTPSFPYNSSPILFYFCLFFFSWAHINCFPNLFFILSLSFTFIPLLQSFSSLLLLFLFYQLIIFSHYFLQCTCKSSISTSSDYFICGRSFPVPLIPACLKKKIKEIVEIFAVI